MIRKKALYHTVEKAWRVVAILGGLALSLAAQAATDSSGSPASIVYRVYLPAASARSVALPPLEFSYSDGRPTVQVPVCIGTIQGMASSVAPAAVPSCAWQLQTDGMDPLTNIAYPDTDAVYWTTKFQPDPALTITVHGSFPDARYISFNVYDGSHSSITRNGVASGLADFRIAPDAGSANPWQQPAAAGGAFTLRVLQDVSTSDSNVLPMPDPVASSGLGLPQPCYGDTGSNPCPPMQQFVLPSSTSGLSPNVDNGYLAALFQPVPGKVLVLRGKAPVAPSGYYALHPEPWPAPVQLRYWSFCNNEYRIPYPVVVNHNPDGSTDTGCMADYQLPRDANGYYTVVVSAPEDRPRNAVPANGVAWLPDSASNPLGRHLLLLRNMLPLGFPQAVQSVTVANDPANAAAAMGEFYPRIYPCESLRFELGGWQACVNQ